MYQQHAAASINVAHYKCTDYLHTSTSPKCGVDSKILNKCMVSSLWQLLIIMLM